MADRNDLYLLVSDERGSTRYTLDLQQPQLLGRDAGCQLVLGDSSVAAEHARLYDDGRGVVIEDLGGGLLHNGRANERVYFGPDDVVTLGRLQLRLCEEPPEPSVRLRKLVTDPGQLWNLDLEPEQTSAAVSKQLSRAESRFSLLLELAKGVGAQQSHERLVDQLIAAVAAGVNPERAVIALSEPDGSLRFEAVWQYGTRSADALVDVSGSILRRVIEQREAFLTDDALANPEMGQLHSVAAKGIRAALCVPLIGRGRVAGAIYADHRGLVGHFDEADLDFLIVLAQLGSVALQNVVDYGRLVAENQQLRQAAEGQVELIGDSPAMQKLRETVAKMAPTSHPVLVLGERGTGKELVARALHRLSGRGTFVPVNCAAIPESLAESALFGHERGAFTGAEGAQAGFFEQADGGTLFLDEIGDLAGPAQAAILRALQEGEIRRVGARQPQTVDVRVVAATNRDLREDIASGSFRADLYDRLDVLSLELPPLRERGHDVRVLAASFCAERKRRISAKALGLLEGYGWPGNVRELRNVIERALVLGDGETIWPEDLPPALRESDASHAYLPTLEALERDHVIRVLRASEGNVSQAARILGIRRVTVYKKLKAYGLDANSFKPKR
jgi:Nif-specific regulatory protein